MFRKSFSELTRLGKNKRVKSNLKIGNLKEVHVEQALNIPNPVSAAHKNENSEELLPKNHLSNLSDKISSEAPSCSPDTIYGDDPEPLISDSDDSDEWWWENLNENDGLKKSLNDWAVSYNISLVSLTALLCLLKVHKCFSNLPSDARTLMNTPYSVSMIPIEPGYYSHIGLAMNLRSICAKLKGNISAFNLLINIDGLPLFKSSSKDFWPILGKIANIPSLKSVIFPIGIYYGSGKPKKCSEYLKEFVEELNELIRQGLVVDDKIISVSVKVFTMDTPAKSFILNTKGHTGYHSCTKCSQSGIWIQNRMTFPELNAPLRNHEDFIEQKDEDFHCGETLLTTIPGLHFIHAFPLDYMHLVCLGVVRSLIYLWMSGPLTTRLPSIVLNEISSELVAVKNCLPSEFNRKPRSLSEVKRWKATEFRQFLLYTGPVILKKVFKKNYESLYNHFLSLSISISILLSPNFCTNIGYSEYAKNLLIHFVKTTMELYGCQYVTSNMHGLVHLVDSVKHFGPLDLSSSFPFENYLQKFKKIVRKGDKPLQQVIKRLSEIMSSDSFSLPSDNIEDCPKFLKPHFKGPLLDSSDPNRQFSSVQLSNFSISTTFPNSCSIFKCGKILSIVNIVFSKEKQKMVVIGREFLEKTNFYSDPFLDSCALSVYIVSNLSNLVEKSVDDMVGKMILLPFKNKQVAFPMLHLI